MLLSLLLVPGGCHFWLEYLSSSIGLVMLLIWHGFIFSWLLTHPFQALTHTCTSTCHLPLPHPVRGSLRPTSASQVSMPTFSQGPVMGVTFFWAAWARWGGLGVLGLRSERLRSRWQGRVWGLQLPGRAVCGWLQAFSGTLFLWFDEFD